MADSNGDAALAMFGAGAVSARHQPDKSHQLARMVETLKLTRYDRRCKPGPSQSYHRLSPGLQDLPTRPA